MVVFEGGIRVFAAFRLLILADSMHLLFIRVQIGCEDGLAAQIAQSDRLRGKKSVLGDQSGTKKTE